MAQLTISDPIYAALSRTREGLECLGLAEVPSDIDAFAESLLITTLDCLRKEMLVGQGKETLLNKFVDVISKRRK